MKYFWIASLFLLACVSTKKKLVRSTVIDFGAIGDGRHDSTKAFQIALQKASAKKDTVYIPKGKYVINRTLKVLSNTVIVGETDGVELFFVGATGVLFRSVHQENITIKNITISGRGRYSSAMSNSTGESKERGIYFTGCSNILVENCRIINFGQSGVAIIGGKHIGIFGNNVEGTHLQSVPLKKGDNYQFGVYIGVSVTSRILEDIIVDGNEISYVCQGIITSQGANDYDAVGVVLSNNFIHDVIGQHGVYCSTSNTMIKGNRIVGMGLEGVKVQASHESLRNIDIVGNSVLDCFGSQAFNITEIHEGKNSISNVIMRNNTAKGCARGLNLYGRLISCMVDGFQLEDVTKEYGIYVRGFSMKDLVLKNIQIKNVKKEAIYIDNDAATQNIFIEKVIIQRRKLSRNFAPIKIINGSNISFIHVSCNGESDAEVYSIAKNCKMVRLEGKLQSQKEKKQ